MKLFLRKKRSGLRSGWRYIIHRNMAECELSALATQCLGDRRIPNIEELNSELHAWYTQRNKPQKGVDWQFTTDDARIKLKRLYPVML